MKKTLFVLFASFVLLAVPAFAEVTASGEVNYYWMFNADDYAEAIDSNDIVLDLGATIGEYTTASVEFEAETDLSGPFVTAEDADGNKMGSHDTPVNMNKVTLTQDVTGALGIDSAVSLAITVGISDFDPKEYNDLTYCDFDLDGEMDPGTIMTKFSIGLAEAVTVDVALYEDYGIAANVYGNVAGIADVSAYYMNNFTTGSWDYHYAEDDATGLWNGTSVPADAEDPYVFGANTAVAVMDGLTAGAGFEYAGWDSDSDMSYIAHYGASVVYTYDALSAGVGAWTDTSDADAWGDFAEVTKAAINASYSVTDMITVVGAFGSVLDAGDDDFSDVMFYEVGAEAVVDNVTYGAGYSLDSDNWGYIGGFKDDDGERAGNMYLYVKAAF